MHYCSASVRAVPAWNSTSLLFSLCQGYSCLKFAYLHYCSASARAVPARTSSASTPFQPLSELFLPGIRLLALLFSLVRAVPAWNSSASPTVQPLSGLFQPGLLVYLLLFNLCHAVLIAAPIPFCFRSPLLPFQIKMLPAYAFSPAAILLSASAAAGFGFPNDKRILWYSC